MQDIDTQCTDDIICPYCGHVFADSWELGDEGEVECDECGMIFNFGADTVVFYWSERDCKLNGEKHDYEFGRQSKTIVIEKCKNCDQTRFVRKQDKERGDMNAG